MNLYAGYKYEMNKPVKPEAKEISSIPEIVKTY